ncbi:MAG: ClbS/DfsB family four-helix bundle protein [Candidatus Doudnabacteria bacterium]|nr:ClbS/DfsB family four-helix bundle protein [Candidatus Doudnabacteria bacterium]
MKLQELIQAAHDDLMDALSGISEDDAVNCIVEKDWSVRDLIANQVIYDHVLGEIYGTQLVTRAGSPYTYQLITMNSKGFDEYHHLEYKSKPYTEIIAELTSRHYHILGMMDQLTDDLLDKKGVLSWYGNEFSVRDYTINSHLPRKKLVAEKIRKFKVKLNVSKHEPSKK